LSAFSSILLFPNGCASRVRMRWLRRSARFLSSSGC